MVRNLVKAALLVGMITMLFCATASADDIWYPWWDRATGTTYFWDDWSNLVGGDYASEAVVLGNAFAPGTVVSSADGLATVNVGDPGAGLIAGPVTGFGSKTNFWDMGPGGAMHVDLPSSDQGMDVWVQITYHVGIAAAPQISIPNATQMSLGGNSLGRWQVVEVCDPNTSLETQWVTYLSLWRIDPGQSFAGIDIITDAQNGAIIDQLVVDTKVLPEPGAVVLGVLGNVALFGIRRYRRK